MCRDLTHKIDAVKPNRAETDRFRAKESPWQRLACPPRLSFARPMTPGLSSMGWGSNWTPCFRSTKPSVLHVRADCGGRLFTAKLAVVAHIWRIRCPIQLLANDAILLTRQFCDCLRDRVDDFIRFIGIDFV
jgi:hypothetical protein